MVAAGHLRNLAKMDVQWAPSLDNALTMLAKNRFDVFVDVSQSNSSGRIVQLGLDHQLSRTALYVSTIQYI